jgi:hypothetical protein
MRDAKAFASVVGIVVKRWPRLSETFVLNEILGLERAGLRLRIYALMDPHEPAAQAEINEVQAPVSYLRTGTRPACGAIGSAAHRTLALLAHVELCASTASPLEYLRASL